MFINTPPLDFSQSNVREEFEYALLAVRKLIEGKQLIAQAEINGKSIQNTSEVASLDPSDQTITIGKVQFANKEHVEIAITELKKTFPIWSALKFSERAKILEKAADLMQEKRLILAALQVREAGKNWLEADLDIVEAIDFLRYYADEAKKFDHKIKLQETLGESNYYFLKARGVVVVIPPWNFPLAIPCGMLAAALVTGNVVAFKPAEQTSLIANELYQIMLQAGVMPGALAFLPGIGSEVGAELVKHPEVNLIAFTGSKQVGKEILEKSLQTSTKHFKKVICELGGKNAIIVDEGADLDEAIPGIIYSSFGFAGQKCSACSRLIVVGDLYESLIERLVSACEDIIIGTASTSNTFLSPVIDNIAKQRLVHELNKIKQEHKLLFESKIPSSLSASCHIPISIFKASNLNTKLWQEELFGPILATTKVNTFDEAIKTLNDSSYALTAGVFSRSPQNIEKAYSQIEAGNIYINRGCTGAIVKRQAFGGYKLSGTGPKAGGPQYLYAFLEEVSLTENTMRKGFTPELS